MPQKKAPWGVLFDMDGVFVQLSHGWFDGIWPRVDAGVLSGHLRQENNKNREYYRSLRRMTETQEREWHAKSIDLYIRGRVTMDMVYDALLDTVVRPGIHECLEALRKEQIPVAIVSWGVANFIEIVLENNNITHLVHEIYAARLTTDERDIIIGHEAESVIFPSTKGKASQEFAQKHEVELERLIAITDSPRDRNLGYLSDHRIGVADTLEECNQLLKDPDFGEAIHLENGDFASATERILSKIRNT